jgi:hypothetical protein
MAKQGHWTAESTDAFVNRLSFDFITQLAKRMESLLLNQAGLAKRLRLTTGRVSQILNNPGNLTLSKMVEYARAVGMKITVVAYDDGDPHNERGPVNSEIFNICWENRGKPLDFTAFQKEAPTAFTAAGVVKSRNGVYQYSRVAGGTTVSEPSMTSEVANTTELTTPIES